jgi:hypothetical protein
MAADAPLANVSDNPAAPSTGTAFRRFRFQAVLSCDMVGPPLSADFVTQSGTGYVIAGRALRK